MTRKLPEHGTAARARCGCSCLPCRQAAAVERGEVIPIAKPRRASRAPRKSVAAKPTEESSSVETPCAAPKVIGEIERSVIEEIKGLVLAQTRPAMAMVARSMAATLDNPKQSAQHAQAARQLTAILETLAGNNGGAKGVARRKSGGRLATVANMTKSRRAQ